MNLMKKITALCLSCAILCGTASATTVYSDSYLKLSSVTVEASGINEDGDPTYTVTATATTPGDNIHHISVQFENGSTEETLSKVLYATDLTEDGVYSGALTVSRYTKAGSYHLKKVTLVDGNDDYFVYVTSSDYDEDSEHQRKLPNSASFQVATGISKADETAPVLTSFSVTPLRIETEEKVTVTAAATEEGSGMDSIKARFVEKTTGRGLSISLEQQSDGTWKETFSASQTETVGVYWLEKVMLKDLAGNRSVLLPGQGVLPKELAFTIVEDGIGSGLPFTDVSEGALYADAVAYVYEQGILRGTSDTTFSPNAAVSRGALVTALYRMDGQNAVTGQLAFSDVDAGAYYAKAVVWAVEQGLVVGYEDGRFLPDAPVTQEQVAVILYRFANRNNEMEVASSNQISIYPDFEQVSEYAIPAMNWAMENGLLQTSGTVLNPAGAVTRAEMATMLMDFCITIQPSITENK